MNQDNLAITFVIGSQN